MRVRLFAPGSAPCFGRIVSHSETTQCPLWGQSAFHTFAGQLATILILLQQTLAFARKRNWLARGIGDEIVVRTSPEAVDAGLCVRRRNGEGVCHSLRRWPAHKNQKSVPYLTNSGGLFVSRTLTIVPDRRPTCPRHGS